MSVRSPMRTCLGCRRSRPQAELLRIVRTSDGGVEADLADVRGGRGAYLCRREACLSECVRRGRWPQAFRAPAVATPGSGGAAARALARGARGSVRRSKGVGDMAGKTRVHELAKELGVAPKLIIDQLHGMGFKEQSSASAIEDSSSRGSGNRSVSRLPSIRGRSPSASRPSASRRSAPRSRPPRLRPPRRRGPGRRRPPKPPRSPARRAKTAAKGKSAAKAVPPPGQGQGADAAPARASSRCTPARRPVAPAPLRSSRPPSSRLRLLPAVRAGARLERPAAVARPPAVTSEPRRAGRAREAAQALGARRAGRPRTRLPPRSRGPPERPATPQPGTPRADSSGADRRQGRAHAAATRGRGGRPGAARGSRAGRRAGRGDRQRSACPPRSRRSRRRRPPHRRPTPVRARCSGSPSRSRSPSWRSACARRSARSSASSSAWA